MPSVEVPEFGTVEFPDEMGADEIKSVLQKRFSPQPRVTVGAPGKPILAGDIPSDALAQMESVMNSPSPITQAIKETQPGKSAFQLLQTPLYSEPSTTPESTVRHLREAAIAAGVSPLSAQEEMSVSARLPGPPSIDKAVSGVAKGTYHLAQGFTSPIGIATLGMGTLPLVAQRAVSLGFAAQMISDFPEQARQLGEEFGKPESERDVEKIAQLITEGAGTAGFTALAAKHGLTAKKPAVIETETVRPTAIPDAIRPVEPISEPAPLKKLGVVEQSAQEPPKSEGLLNKPNLSADELINIRPDELVMWKKNVGLGAEVEKTIARALKDEDIPALELERDNLRAKAAALNSLMEKRGKVDDRTMRVAGEESVKAQTINEILQERETFKAQNPLPEEGTRTGATDTPPATQPELVGMGGATPSEFKLSPETPTSIKNAQVDVERRKRGLPPAIEPAKRSFGAVWDETMAKIDRDPGYQDRLVGELREKPRSLTDSEDASLLHRQIDLQNEYGKATRDLAQAHDDGRMDAVGEQKARVAALSDQLLDLYNINKKVGTETGRGLNARKMMAYEDFSLAKMELEKRAVNDGRPLTDAERTEVTALNHKIEKTQKAYDDYVSKSEDRIRELEINRALEEAKRAAKTEPSVHPRILAEAERVVKIMERSADAARERLKAKFGRTSAGVDPTILADVSIIGAAKIARGVVDFAKWSDVMIKDVGEGVRPFLKDAWASANKSFNDSVDKYAKAGSAAQVKRAVKKSDSTEQKQAAIDTIKERVESGNRSEIAGQVQKLARLFVEQGVKTRDELIDSVHGVLREIDPSFTRRDAMDAISGYGDFKQLTKDAISVQLRDLKGQMQQVAKLEDMQAGQPPRKTGVERRIPSQEESRLIKQVNEAKNQFQIPITDEATQLKSSLDTLKTRLKNRTLELQDKLAKGDFAKREKRVVQMDAEANRLHFEASKAKIAWHEALMKDRLANRTLPEKLLGNMMETLNTSRAILTSMDLSAVLRQGGFIALAHPIRAAKAFPAMFRAFRSEAGQHAVNQEILLRKNYPLYNQSKLYLSEHGQKLSQMEEAYMSCWADKIPLVAGSQRAYVTFLNKLRADSFDAMANSLSRSGELTPAEASAISNFINVATGRGNVGMKENALVRLNTVFFAPRYVASRFQLLVGQPLYGGNARTRALIAKEYARYLIGVGVVYGLATLDGAEVEQDPRSSDFGKLRYGNTRLDPLSGLSQATVLLSRLATGETKKLDGKMVPIVGKVPFGQDDAFDVGARFLRTKLAPVPSALINLRTGEDVVGQPVTAESTAEGLLVPLAFRDIYDAMIEQGVPRGTAFAILSMFGYGLQTYDKNKPTRK